MSDGRLHVEGNDDDHSIRHLLRANGIPLDTLVESNEFKIIARNEDSQPQSVAALLRDIPMVIRRAGTANVGFVVDADDSLADRWRAVRDRLSVANLIAPAELPEEGWVSDPFPTGARVGVWIMPDNRTPGSLEHLLEKLVPAGDLLLKHAHQATDHAMNLVARTPNQRIRLKSVLHAWLAWQETPGRPYGTALNGRYFKPDSAAAQAFVVWAKRLFGWV